QVEAGGDVQAGEEGSRAGFLQRAVLVLDAALVAVVRQPGMNVRQPRQVGQVPLGVALVEILARPGGLDGLLLRQVQDRVEVNRQHLRLDLRDADCRRRSGAVLQRRRLRGFVVGFLLLIDRRPHDSGLRGGGRQLLRRLPEFSADAPQSQGWAGGQPPAPQAYATNAGKREAGAFDEKSPTVSGMRAAMSVSIGSVGPARNLSPLWGNGSSERRAARRDGSNAAESDDCTLAVKTHFTGAGGRVIYRREV